MAKGEVNISPFLPIVLRGRKGKAKGGQIKNIQTEGCTMGEIITIRKQNIEIEGEITTRTKGDIEVCLRSPYGAYRLSRGLHNPYFARKFVDFTGEEGLKRARQLLEGLYDLGSFIEQHWERLREMYREWQTQIEPLQTDERYLTEEAFRENKRKLKQQYKQNKIGQTAYQDALKAMEDQYDAYRFEQDKMWDVLFGRYFPDTPDCFPRSRCRRVIMAAKND